MAVDVIDTYEVIHIGNDQYRQLPTAVVQRPATRELVRESVAQRRAGQRVVPHATGESCGLAVCDLRNLSGLPGLEGLRISRIAVPLG